MHFLGPRDSMIGNESEASQFMILILLSSFQHLRFSFSVCTKAWNGFVVS